MSLLPSFTLAIMLSLGACAVDDSSMVNEEERSDLVEVIEYHKPDAPTAIEYAEGVSFSTSNHSIAYGHCSEPEPQDDGVINIDCKAKWSELTWLSFPKELAAQLVEQGQTSLTLDLGILSSTIEDESVRLSIHAVDEEGKRTKVLSESNVLDGDTLEVDLQAQEYQIFVARGKNSFLVWGNGSIEFDLRASTD